MVARLTAKWMENIAADWDRKLELIKRIAEAKDTLIERDKTTCSNETTIPIYCNIQV